WYAGTKGFYAYNGTTWVVHDLTSAGGGGGYWRVTARAIDDAWGITYETESTGNVVRLCHWDGKAWSCEMIPFAMGGAWIDQYAGRVLSVSPSSLWAVDPQKTQRRGSDGVWHELPWDGSACDDVQVIDDDHAFATCESQIFAFDGTRFTRMDTK